MRLLAIDGNSIMNRAFYGIKMLSNKNGVFTNAITGFMNIFLRVTDDISPDVTVCAFDMRAPTFRHKASASYKANRKGMPDELHMQMPYIKDILTASGLDFKEVQSLDEAMPELDVLYMTRIQQERFASKEDYLAQKGFYILDRKKLESAKHDLVILH
ncbi:MAG: hypothetical protein IIU25_04185, partial [Oscillospiraceae bacterium]|nr:hypothetical protein [Oscillospiraceae bacterium]